MTALLYPITPIHILLDSGLFFFVVFFLIPISSSDSGNLVRPVNTLIFIKKTGWGHAKSLGSHLTLSTVMET